MILTKFDHFQYCLELLTGVILNASGNFTCTHLVKICDVLTENGLQISFTNTPSVHFACVDPDIHEDVRGKEHSNACRSHNDYRLVLRNDSYHSPIRASQPALRAADFLNEAAAAGIRSSAPATPSLDFCRMFAKTTNSLDRSPNIIVIRGCQIAESEPTSSFGTQKYSHQ